MGLDSDQKQFINETVAVVHGLIDQGIVFNPRVLIAQAILESGWGRSQLASKYHNYFGLKAGSLWRGETVALPTREVIDSKEITEKAVWRVYDCLEKSIIDYVDFIAQNLYFNRALNYVDDDEKYLSVLVDNNVKYATDPNYKQLIKKIIVNLELDKSFPVRV